VVDIVNLEVNFHPKVFVIIETSGHQQMSESTNDVASYPHHVLPGKVFATNAQPIKLGPGLRHINTPSGETLIQATQAGLLYNKKQTSFYVDYNSHRVSHIPTTTNSSTFQVKANQ
jgi:Exosome complex exonuclease Rrp40 N-terminal domain